MMNARIYIKIFMAILFLGMMPSCTYDTIHVGGLNEHANVTLTLALDDQVLNVSRVADGDTETSVDPETVINSVDLFFYGKDATETTAPIHVQKGLVPNTDGTISFSMPVDNFNDLFPNEATTTCKVFAIVNRPTANDNDNVLPADAEATVANLKNMVLYTDFVSTQTPFVMHSNVMVTINRDKDSNSLNGTIPVKRVAAKIGFELVYPEDETNLSVKNASGVTQWTATSENVRIKFFFGSKRTYLGAAFTQYASSDIFNSDYTAYTDNLSFYTYPTNWSGDEKAHTHLMVEVTWTEANVEEGKKPETKTTYYEISNLNPGSESIESNNYYLIQQSISILGADSEDEAVELTPCYNVLDWGAAGLSGVLNRNRYLAVDETNVIMNNIVTKKIQFASSDPIDLTSAEVFWHYAGQQEAEDLPMVTYTNSSISKVDEKTYTLSSTTAPITGVANRINGDYVVTIKINNTQKYIEISHALDNSLTNGSDFTKYMINLKVEHFVEESEDKGLEETINITQYPMISVEAEVNSDYGKDGDANENTKYGYVFVNGKQEYNRGSMWGGGAEWYNIGGLNTGVNHNPNKYIIKVSSLAGTNNYTIGDPRETTPRVPTNITKTVNGKTLTYYYPTNPDADEKMIAPEFMVASSYGYCPGDISSLAVAEQRCATYQEDGYPAGRWRVPTYAEVSYIIQLSGWGSIPELYSGMQWYWTAQGAVTYQNGGISNPSNSGQRVRCVYDTWYWGKEQVDKETFTYGDKQR